MVDNQTNLVNDCIDSALKCEQKIVLKEQLLAVKELLNGEDVLAVLPTGFGKSMIFTVFELVLKNCTSLFVSLNRKNLRISVTKLKKDEMLQDLDWIVNVIKENSEKTPKTILNMTYNVFTLTIRKNIIYTF